ncbi:T9SS type A sorting domain-containing protein [Flavobacterium sp. J372]|uniref:ELWxxDGT repeat protein n=1 Tax=Flavobacterium sp. J372 TaxID=2898436 RepID=UPI002150BF81|nr:ELWxxDGT repeat protein [Flavobacterium sp. J372]MCR5862371.1 T9SS type A sorting domain-containing protein [Flavobacterium sp. J372]
MTDGTDAGTQTLTDFGQNGFNNSLELFTFGNKLYYIAHTATYGHEIWVSDGTSAGTWLLKDINPGTSSSSPSKIIVFGSHFYFLANNGTNGSELWRSDGTTQGTVLYKEFVPGMASAINYQPGTATASYFVFTVGEAGGIRKFWRCDGSEAGTYPLKTVSTSGQNFTNFAVFNDEVYMLGGDFNSENQLWKTDGTVAGTTVVKNYQSDTYRRLEYLTTGPGYLLFRIYDGSTSTYRPYISLGTEATTGLLSDVNVATDTSSPFKFCTAGNVVLFLGTTTKNGRELWSTDGTSDGTKMVADINRSRHGLHPYGDIYSSVLGNEIVTIRFTDGTSNKPIITQNASNDFILLDNASTSAANVYYDEYYSPKKIFYNVGNKIVYKGIAYNSTGMELYATDGTPSGTSLIKDIAPGAAHSLGEDNNLFMEYNGILYFNANDQVHGKELWRTDGTPDGTYMVKDIRVGSQSGVMRQNEYSSMKQYAVYNNMLYFIANDGTGDAIWRTDGTANGTIMVMPVTSSTIIMGATTTKMFFISKVGQYSQGPDTIWSTDGTQAGTTLLKTYLINVNKFDISAVMNDEIYYNAWEDEIGMGLAKSDGTVQGTVFIKPSHPESINMIEKCGGHLYVATGNSGDLWRSDGTAAGTEVIYTNMYTSSNYSCIANNFYFTKSALTQNLWVATGVGNAVGIDVNFPEDIMPVTYGGPLGILGYANGKIFLDGQTDINGREIFTVELQAVQAALGLDDIASISEKNEYYVYPNPSSNIVNIKGNTPVKSYILNSLTGQKLIEKENSDTVELGNLQPGIYLLSIKGINGSATVKKIVKK